VGPVHVAPLIVVLLVVLELSLAWYCVFYPLVVLVHKVVVLFAHSVKPK
jgi:hypothetical protein